MLTLLPLWRRAVAELVGTGLLVTVIVGAGIAAQTLSPGNVGLQLFETSTATAFGLAVLILMFGPVSGGHFNPVVSLGDWWLGRRTGTGLSPQALGVYIAAQLVGGILGAVLANLMYRLPAVEFSTQERTGIGLWLGEVVATFGLVFLVVALARSGRAALAAPAVGAYLGAAFWFTSSTSFANPAVTVGRAFTDTFTGIAPASLLGFILAQLVGLLVAVGLVMALYPDAGRAAADIVVPRSERRRA